MLVAHCEVRLSHMLVNTDCRIELHRLAPVVDSRYSAEAVDAGYARLRSGETFGKVLFTL